MNQANFPKLFDSVAPPAASPLRGTSLALLSKTPTSLQRFSAELASNISQIGVIASSYVERLLVAANRKVNTRSEVAKKWLQRWPKNKEFQLHKAIRA